MKRIRRIPLAIFITSALSACNLTVENEGGGVVTSDSGTILCGDVCKVSHNETVTEILTATPDDGYEFTGWSGSGCSGTETCSVTISNSGNKSVKAEFSKSATADDLVNLPYTDETSTEALITDHLIWSMTLDAFTKNIAKPGVTAQIKGKGFSTNSADNQVVFETDSGFVIADTVAVDESTLTVTMPENVTGLFTVTNNFRSNLIDIEMFEPEVAVLALEYFFAAEANESVTLKGEGFTAPMTATVGDTQVTANVVDENTLQLTIPATASSGKIAVTNGSGTSNSIDVRIVKNTLAQITLPSGSTLNYDDLEVSGASLDSTLPNATGLANVSTSTTGLDFIHVTWVDGDSNDHLYFMGWSLPSSNTITLSATSTAESLVAFSLHGLKKQSLAEIEGVMDIISDTPEVQALANLLETQLVANSDFMATGSVAYFQALNLAVNAVTNQLDDPQPVTALKEPLQGPDITPEETAGISVIEDSNNGAVTGFANVSNKTPVFLSAEFIDDETGEPVSRHAEGYFDQKIVNPSSFFSFASVQDKFKVCQFIDCSVEIVTPGQNSKSTNDKLAGILAARTIIEGVFFPVISEALDIDLKPKELTKILVSAAPSAVNVMGNQVANGGNADFAIKTFVDFIIADLTPNPNVGSITKKFAAKYGADIGAQVSKRIAAKLIPVLGQISLMLDAVGFTGGALNVGHTMSGIVTTPGDLDFEIVWPLQVTGIIPGSVRYDAGPTTLILTGQGLNKISEVVLLDLGQASPHSATLDIRTITDDHRGASVLISGDFLENAAGPVQVIAKSDVDPQSESPENLEIEACSPLILDRYRAIDADGADPLTDCSIVKDKVSGLEWQRCAFGQIWNNNTQSCEGSANARYRPGHWLTEEPYNIETFLDDIPAGWRMPSASELRTLVYCSTGSPILIDMTLDDTQCGVGSSLPTISPTAFPNTPSAGFWTSTPAGNDFWWVARFDLGKVNGGGYNLPYHMRYVR